MLAADGKVQLQFVPQIQHADKKKTGQLLPTLALGLQGNRTTETFSAISWDLPLDANEYIIIGTRFDKPQSLGFCTMVTTDNDRPIQRLLAIRRLGQSADAALPITERLPTRPKVSAGPLAIP